ncbi:unnamed protein product [Cylicocyclus nassatus]|uniref:Uncharacterized protein n=1 Tax=Cylicocyclus nassatus TaxID=53992 RepID=A0AA36DQG6_CYLNA|nr:unnamed protein product [Cylicocyclus nassatus]
MHTVEVMPLSTVTGVVGKEDFEQHHLSELTQRKRRCQAEWERKDYRKRTNFRCIVLAALFGISAAIKGFDTVQNLSIDKFQCLKDNGYMFFIGRIWKSLGEFDWDGLQNIKNAFEAGFYVSVYIFPCLDFPKCAPVQDQVEETINRLNDEGVKYGMVFLDIQMLDWPSDKEGNRNTIDAMGQKLDEMGVEWGIYTNKRNWNAIVGDWDKWKHKKLWWSFWGNNDGERYSDFEPFGGWTDFYMQQYAGDFNGPCSVSLDLDYYA